LAAGGLVWVGGKKNDLKGRKTQASRRTARKNLGGGGEEKGCLWAGGKGYHGAAGRHYIRKATAINQAGTLKDGSQESREEK